MRTHAPAPAYHQSIAMALLLALTLALLSSGCSTSAKENSPGAKPAPLHVEFLGAWGAKGSGPGLLSDPRTIATDAYGDVYIVDAAFPEHFIQKFTRDGHPLFSFQPVAPIHNPCASDVDLHGAIYSLECGPGALYIFKPEGDLIHSIRGGLGKPSQPSSVTVDDDGRIYVAESHDRRIFRYTPRGAMIGSWGGKGTGPGTTLHGDQIIASFNGSLFVFDSDRGWFARISPSGMVQKEWTLPVMGANSNASAGNNLAKNCRLALTKSSVVALCGPSFGLVLHVFSFDGEEKLAEPLQDIDPSLVNVTSAGIAAMQDGELFILDAAVPRVLRFRVNQ